MNAHQRARLLGRPYRSGYEGEGTGGGWGDWGGGSDSGGQDVASSGAAAAAPAPAASAPAISEVADSFIGSPATLVGAGSFTGAADFGFAPGPLTAVDAQEWAGSLAQPEQPLLALEPVNIQAQPVAQGEVIRSTSVDLLAFANNAANFVLGLLGIGTGTGPGVIGGARAIAGTINSPSAFTETTTYSVSGGLSGNPAAGSPAPDVFGSQATGAVSAAAAFAGADSGAADNVSGSPVLGFGGAIVNDTPTGAPGGALGASPGLGGALGAPGGVLRGRYGAPSAPAASSTNNAAPVLALAGAASLLFMG